MEEAVHKHKDLKNHQQDHSDDVIKCIEDAELFEAHLYLDVFRGRDSNGKFGYIKLHCLRIRAKVPGVDPCIAIKQWLDYAPPEYTQAFYDVVAHMSFAVNQKVGTSSHMLVSSSWSKSNDGYR